MNIILFDHVFDILPNILKNTDWDIAVLVVVSNQQKRFKIAMNPRIKEIYSIKDLLDMRDVSSIDYKLLEQYKGLQALTEASYLREDEDFQSARYRFYTSVSFWNTILAKKQIDLCVVVDAIHGFRGDAILMKMAKNNGIPCFNIYPATYGKNAIYDCNNEKMIAKGEKFIESIDMNEGAFYKISLNGNKSRLKKLVYSILGRTGFVCLRQIIRRQWKFSLDDIRQENIISYLYSSLKVKYIQKWTEKYYCKFNPREKYIIYFLHFRPEATITNYCNIMDSELVVIKMLSETLPKGWRLYVKEHPDAHKLGTDRFNHFIYAAPKFMSRQYFASILSIDKVELLDYRLSSADLIKGASAIATMAGTVALEAVRYKIPVLVFAPQKVIYRQCKDFFLISSTAELREAIIKITNGFKPQYDDFEKQCEQYLLNDSEHGWEQVLDIIKCSVKA